MFIETSSNDFYMATFTPKLEPLAAWMQFLGFPLLFWCYLQYPSLPFAYPQHQMPEMRAKIVIRISL